MAVTITSIARGLAAPCQHFRLTANVNGRTMTRDITLDDISSADLDDAILRIVKYYVIDRGQGAAGVVGKTILPDVL